MPAFALGIVGAPAGGGNLYPLHRVVPPAVYSRRFQALPCKYSPCSRFGERATLLFEEPYGPLKAYVEWLAAVVAVEWFVAVVA